MGKKVIKTEKAAAAKGTASAAAKDKAPRSRRRRAPAEDATDGDGQKKKVRLAQQSTAEYAANVGATLAESVPESQREARVLQARDYRGIHLFADPKTGAVYDPDDIIARVINPRELDPALLARLGPWVPSTGLVSGGGGGGGGVDGVGEDDDF